MAVIQGDIVGVVFNDSHSGKRGHAEVFFTVDSYDASADTGKLGSGGKLFGTTSTLSLEDMLESVRRDGHTLNIVDCMAGQSGLDGTTAFYADTTAVSTDDVTFEIADIDSTEIDATGSNGADGIYGRPMSILVAYDITA